MPFCGKIKLDSLDFAAGSGAGAGSPSSTHPKKAVLQTVFGSDSDDEQPHALAVIQPAPVPHLKQAKPSRRVFLPWMVWMTAQRSLPSMHVTKS